MSNQDDIQFNSEEVALVKKTKETISVELGETISVALDANATSGADAKKLLKKFQAIKTAKSRLEANYEKTQAELYALLGYVKIGSSWVGIAKEGTIAGVPVVVIGTQNRESLDKEELLKANPHLVSLFADYTSTKVSPVMKTPQMKNDAELSPELEIALTTFLANLVK
jgi:hypothetical protein